jgi:hypothetical protein
VASSIARGDNNCESRIQEIRVLVHASLLLTPGMLPVTKIRGASNLNELKVIVVWLRLNRVIVSRIRGVPLLPVASARFCPERAGLVSQRQPSAQV